MTIALRQLVIPAMVVAALSAALLMNEFHAVSSDAGQHYALVRALMDLENWGSPAPAANLGVTAKYPPVSHWLAAEMGKILHSGLLGMTVVASAAVGLFYLAMFTLSIRINWRVPLIACVLTIIYALCRGPVFGRQIVVNYFFAQLVGSTFAAWALLIVLLKLRKWKGMVLDGFVLVTGQIIVATHLTPAAQLLAAYCTILLVQAWTRSSRTSFARLMVFSSASLLLTFLNPFARELVVVAQGEGGAHIVHLLGHRLTQILALSLACYLSAKLILRTYQDEDAGMFLGCMCLSASVLAFIQMALLWAGFGSHYAVMKHLFVITASFIFVLAAHLSFKWDAVPVNKVGSNWKQLALCSALALLATRADLFPSVVDLEKVVVFQNGVRELMAKVEPGGRVPIVLSGLWSRNIVYAIMLGDLRVSRSIADQILAGEAISPELVSVVLMPIDDPMVVKECSVPAYSNRWALALDYSCILRSPKPGLADLRRSKLPHQVHRVPDGMHDEPVFRQL